MAYDERLAQRIRNAHAANRAVTERKMFGGIAFLRKGLMFVGILSRRGISTSPPESSARYSRSIR